MLSYRELERAARVLHARLAGHRVQAVSQPDDHAVVLTSYGPVPGSDERGRRHVLLCCRPDSARVSLLAAPPAARPRPGGFVQYLRAHVMGASVGGVRIVDDDRQLAIRLRASEGDFDLLLAVLGRRCNLVLLDASGCVVSALRPLSETRPELALGEPWRAPGSGRPRSGEDRFEDEPDERFLQAVEAAYAASESADDAARLRRKTGRALDREARRLDRRLEKLEGELDQARRAAQLERHGELLKGVLDRIQRGQREVVARDHATGEDVSIALDPSLSPAENLERLFKRYRKAVRGLTRAGAQQDAVREARGALEETARRFRELPEDDAAALETFAAQPAVRRLLERAAPRPPAPPRDREQRLAGQRLPGRLMPRRYRSAAGLEVWVGRSDAGNDHLSTRLARGNDLFFHLDGAPGSHVVLRTEGRTDPPSEAVLDACELAVHFSKARNAGRADVHVVPIKNVRKPKGAKPGLVTVHGGKTVHLRRSPERLQRVLASRLDDGGDGDVG